MTENAKERTFAVLGLVLALGFPALPVSKWEGEFVNVRHLIGYETIWWSVILVLLFHVTRVEQQPLKSIGFKRMTLKDVGVGVLGGVATLTTIAILYLTVFPVLHGNESRQFNELALTPAWWKVISVLRAAAGEEVLFRGYAISRLRTLGASRDSAAFVSWLIFTVEHLGIWGWGHLLIAGVGGAALTVIFLWRGNIWASIIAHAVIDGAAVLQ